MIFLKQKKIWQKLALSFLILCMSFFFFIDSNASASCESIIADRDYWKNNHSSLLNSRSEFSSVISLISLYVEPLSKSSDNISQLQGAYNDIHRPWNRSVPEKVRKDPNKSESIKISGFDYIKKYYSAEPELQKEFQCLNEVLSKESYSQNLLRIFKEKDDSVKESYLKELLNDPNFILAAEATAITKEYKQTVFNSKADKEIKKVIGNIESCYEKYLNDNIAAISDVENCVKNHMQDANSLIEEYNSNSYRSDSMGNLVNELKSSINKLPEIIKQKEEQSEQLKRDSKKKGFGFVALLVGVIACLVFVWHKFIRKRCPECNSLNFSAVNEKLTGKGYLHRNRDGSPNRRYKPENNPLVNEYDITFQCECGNKWVESVQTKETIGYK